MNYEMGNVTPTDCSESSWTTEEEEEAAVLGKMVLLLTVLVVMKETEKHCLHSLGYRE